MRENAAAPSGTGMISHAGAIAVPAIPELLPCSDMIGCGNGPFPLEGDDAVHWRAPAAEMQFQRDMFQTSGELSGGQGDRDAAASAGIRHDPLRGAFRETPSVGQMPEDLEDLIVIGAVGQRESQFLCLPGYYNRTLLKFNQMEQGTPIKQNVKQEITKRGKNCLPKKPRNHHRQNLNLFPKGGKSNEYT